MSLLKYILSNFVSSEIPGTYFAATRLWVKLLHPFSALQICIIQEIIVKIMSSTKLVCVWRSRKQLRD